MTIKIPAIFTQVETEEGSCDMLPAVQPRTIEELFTQLWGCSPEVAARHAEIRTITIAHAQDGQPTRVASFVTSPGRLYLLLNTLWTVQTSTHEELLGIMRQGQPTPSTPPAADITLPTPTVDKKKLN